MISLETALALKEAGLQWRPQLYDFFGIPDTDLAERIFVISDLMAELAVLKGFPAITFNGSVEWALDYILQTEAVWLPREAQLRAAILAHAPSVQLVSDEGHHCTVRGETFVAAEASEAYAAALLYLLQS